MVERLAEDAVAIRKIRLKNQLMKRVCLTVIGMCITLAYSFAQVTPKDSTGYVSKRLKLDEVNIVSSYYSQTADKSAVSGGDPGPTGIGNVTDLSNGVEVNFIG